MRYLMAVMVGTSIEAKIIYKVDDVNRTVEERLDFPGAKWRASSFTYKEIVGAYASNFFQVPSPAPEPEESLGDDLEVMAMVEINRLFKRLNKEQIERILNFFQCKYDL